VNEVETHDMQELLGEHPFFAGMRPEQIAFIAGCAANAAFAEGEALFVEGDRADRFYLLRGGEVSLELRMPARGANRIQTIRPGEVLGWSWLFAPYRWHFDARALERVHVFRFDGDCLRRKCDRDHEFGYQLMRRFAGVMVARLQAARLQALDLYGTPA
jgi:CRP-like cAMP-binding protein